MVAQKRPLSQLRVAVLGVSRAGLPLALLLAERGHQVGPVEANIDQETCIYIRIYVHICIYIFIYMVEQCICAYMYIRIYVPL